MKKVAELINSATFFLFYGYNSSSKDFYVKVERGNIENQYPTQDMMKTKAYLMSLNSDS